ncbi:MAG: glutamine synthetase beta-grasp domain-containing protein, partial [Clostridium sp.]
MAKYTRQDILDLIEEEDVKFIRLQFTDIAGNLKNMATTVDQIDKILGGRCRFNCAAVDGFRGVGYEELFLVPDLDTFVTFPWRPQNGKVARFICDIVKPDGTPFKGSSRYILKKVIAEAEQMGYTLDVGIK